MDENAVVGFGDGDYSYYDYDSVREREIEREIKVVRAVLEMNSERFDPTTPA